jgi:hypothetical protein
VNWSICARIYEDYSKFEEWPITGRPPRVMFDQDVRIRDWIMTDEEDAGFALRLLEQMIDKCDVSCIVVIYISNLEALVEAFIRARKRAVFTFLYVDSKEADKRLVKPQLLRLLEVGVIIQVSTLTEIMHGKIGTSHALLCYLNAN